MQRLFRLFQIPLIYAAVFFFSSLLQGQEVSRHDILNYALDSEILELIDELIEEENTEYNEDLYNLFLRSKNDSVREGVLRFFATLKNPILEEECAEILEDPYDVRKSLLSAAVNYAGETGLSSLLPALHSLAESGNYDFASPAVKAIAKTGSSDDAVFLINLMEEDFFDNEKQQLVFRQDIISVIINLDCSEIRWQLAEIAGNTEENAVIRAGAANALGTLKNSEDIDTIASLFNESDPVLRSASVSALSNFNSDSAAKDIILEAFKDSYYKVRQEALSAAEKMNLSEAIPYILYRAKTDPVESIKLQAYEVLGALGREEGKTFLTETLKDEKAGGKLRVKAAEVLLEYHFESSCGDIAKIAMSAVNDEKQSWLCHELGKLFAGIESENTAELSAAYLSSGDVLSQSIGLDMYEKNRYASVRSIVENLATNKNAGALQRRAEKILNEESEGTGTDGSGIQPS